MLTTQWRKSTASAYNGNCLEARWHVSSHSGGTNCLEARWQTSSHSVGNGACVEARAAGVARVQVRDSKDREGGVLEFTPGAWMEFLGRVKAGAWEPQPVPPEQDAAWREMVALGQEIQGGD